jgi:prepilin-type N-terminal cleavage/methylation domain-containing protein
MNQDSFLQDQRRGVTLIELLIVITLLCILTAATVPVMAPAIESRKLREAARGVSVFFSSARSRAIQTGRPVGVEIRRLNLGGNVVNGVSLALYEIEIPLPYGGDDVYSLAQVNFGPPASNGIATGTVTVINGFRTGFVSPGDRIQIGLQGPTFLVTSFATANGLPGPTTISPLPQQPPPTPPTPLPPTAWWRFTVQANTVTNPLPWPPNTDSQYMPYQIFRQPARTSSEPYQLPDGAIIDVDGSGVGPDGLFSRFDGANQLVNDVWSVLVTFAPSGSVSAVYRSPDGTLAPVGLPPEGDVFILVGKREKAPLDHVAKNYNWVDPQALWVSIRSQSGQVVTTATAPDPNVSPPTYLVPTAAAGDAMFPAQIRASVMSSRLFARQAYSEGGR